MRKYSEGKILLSLNLSNPPSSKGMESLGRVVVVQISRSSESKILTLSRSHRTSSFTTCWAGNRASRK